MCICGIDVVPFSIIIIENYYFFTIQNLYTFIENKTRFYYKNSKFNKTTTCLVE